MRTYKFVPVPLPYSFDALEPVIDGETVRIHYGQHYTGYINNLNVLLSGYPKYCGYTLEQLISSPLGSIPSDTAADIRFNAGGVYAHELYFAGLRPPSATGYINSDCALIHEIKRQYSTINDFLYEIKQAGMNIKGSGWVWLVWTGHSRVNGRSGLLIVSTSNHDVPNLSKCVPLFALDVWEHSYYLKYRWERKVYLDNILSIIDFDSISSRMEGLF